MIQAAPLDGIVQLARPVAGKNGYRRHFRAHGSNFRNADLVFPQILQQKRLERLIGPVHLVDQQHCAGRRGLQCLQQRPAYQVAVLIDLAFNVGRLTVPLDGAHMQELGGVVPFVESLALLEPVVTLQSDQLPLQRHGQRLGQLGLAHTGLALQQQRALQLER